MYISRGAINNAVQFLEIESELSKDEIMEIFFKHLKYELPGDEKLNRRKNKNGEFSRKYFRADDEFNWLEISENHAYIYIGDSDGNYYRNSFVGAIDFIYRSQPENKHCMCSIM